MSEPVNAFDASIIEKASHVGPAGIEIAYQRRGNPGAPVLLLVMGIGGQLIHWPDTFCQDLVDRGVQVIRFDNRDAGLSTHMGDVAYTMSDMAGDAVGLLDALSVEKAHIVGASMGGAIAQTIAIEHRGRVRSLTSMMSTTGNTRVGQHSREALREVLGGSRAGTRDEIIQQRLRAARAVGSPGYPPDENEMATRAARAYDRGHDPMGFLRQARAASTGGDRTERLKNLMVPALVIHGLADRMCDPSGGRATAEAIPGAELLLVEGLGHDFPPGLRSELAARISDFVWRVEKQTI